MENWTVDNIDGIMVWRKLNIYLILSNHSTTESHPESCSLLTKIPNVQDKFCGDRYTRLGLQRLITCRKERQIVYGVTFWLVREVFPIFG